MERLLATATEHHCRAKWSSPRSVGYTSKKTGTLKGVSFVSLAATKFQEQKCFFMKNLFTWSTSLSQMICDIVDPHHDSARDCAVRKSCCDRRALEHLADSMESSIKELRAGDWQFIVTLCVNKKKSETLCISKHTPRTKVDAGTPLEGRQAFFVAETASQKRL
jgi:hypothetical protein